ncbi:hypothetical protein VNO77_01245 [Canavalia gladiata]|uniref:Uncharacterized protein n=1 Tax=Canavalia gladiata TaxID=3824 RepID=A0AAN9MRJ1_CANGL
MDGYKKDKLIWRGVASIFLTILGEVLILLQGVFGLVRVFWKGFRLQPHTEKVSRTTGKKGKELLLKFIRSQQIPNQDLKYDHTDPIRLCNGLSIIEKSC